MSEVQIKRDQWGRPLIPHPKTGKVQAWTRATTLASTISDRFALEQWAQRHIVRGFALNETLMLRAAAAGEDKTALQHVAQAALDAAQSSEAAAIGTALHTITERLDAGEAVDVPESFRPDVEAYQRALADAELTVERGWIERFVVTPEVEAAGTADRLYVSTAGVALPMIGDLKTGANAIKFGMLEIAAQLAIYSRASHWWDGEKLHAMPPVDQAAGIVAHMPARGGECTLYVVDLMRGWQIAQLCYEARKWRKADKLAQPMPPKFAGVEDGAPATPDEAVRARVKDIVQALEGAALPVPWPAGVLPPKRQEGQYTDDEIGRITRWCDVVATHTTAPAH